MQKSNNSDAMTAHFMNNADRKPKLTCLTITIYKYIL